MEETIFEAGVDGFFGVAEAVPIHVIYYLFFALSGKAILINKSKGGTADCILHPELCAKGMNEGGFACAHFSTESQYAAGVGELPKLLCSSINILKRKCNTEGRHTETRRYMKGRCKINGRPNKGALMLRQE